MININDKQYRVDKDNDSFSKDILFIWFIYHVEYSRRGRVHSEISPTFGNA